MMDAYPARRAGRQVLIIAVSGAVTAGIGSAFGGFGGSVVTAKGAQSLTGLAKSLGSTFAYESLSAGAHGLANLAIQGAFGEIHSMEGALTSFGVGFAGSMASSYALQGITGSGFGTESVGDQGNWYGNLGKVQQYMVRTGER